MLVWTLFGLVAMAQEQAVALSSPGCLDGGQPARVKEVGPAFDLVLEDGRDILLAGIDPPRTPTTPIAEKAHTALNRWLAGRSVSVAVLAAQPDRWGRTVGLAFAPGQDAAASGGSTETSRVSVAEAMLDAGFGRARPSPLVAACWPGFLDLEKRARQAGLGLWKEPYYAVIGAEDRAGLSSRTGEMAIVEGRVARVFEGRARTYVSFGGDRSGFAVTVERRIGAMLRKTGTDLAGWKGRRVRVRGFLDDRFGIQIELNSLDQIEFIEP